jgi:Kef-type K+ transport system membrane component KefB
LSDYWFKPKRYGYGATPANWKGWLAMLVFVLVDLALAFWLIVRPVLAGTGPTLTQVVLFMVLMFAVTAVLIWVSVIKTDGKWRWRWGKE